MKRQGRKRKLSPKTIELKKLTIEIIQLMRDNYEAFQIHNPGGELFQHEQSEVSDKDCLLVDIQSANVIIKIYEALSDGGQLKFNSLLQDEYRLANFLDSMWEMVK